MLQYNIFIILIYNYYTILYRYLRKVFRKLQLLCRKHRNIILKNCYGSLTCKKRKLQNIFQKWKQKLTLSKQIYYISIYNIKKKIIKILLKYKYKKEYNQYKLQRCKLRFIVNRLKQSIKLWYNIIKNKLKYKYLLNIYKKMHPILEISYVRTIFTFWKLEYTIPHKIERQKSYHIRKKHKLIIKKQYFDYFYEVYQAIVVKRVQLQRGLAKIYLFYQYNKQKYSHFNHILALSAAALQSKEYLLDLSNRRLKELPYTTTITTTSTTTTSSSSNNNIYYNKEHNRLSLTIFLLQKGLNVHTNHQFKSFRLQCFLRRYYKNWYIYSKCSKIYYKQRQYCYNQCILQCTTYFSNIYHVHNKHHYWQQWRSLYVWYQLLQRRRIYITRRNIRIVAKQYFLRWLEVYNRRLINHHMCIPSTTVVAQTVISRVLQPCSTTTNTTTTPPTISSSNQLLTHRGNISQSRDYSALLQRSFQSNTSVTLDHNDAVSVDMAPVMPSFALDESINLLQLHPTAARIHQQARLHSLSLSTIYPMNTSTNSSSSYYRSTGGGGNTEAVSGAQYSSSKYRKVGRIIDRTTATTTPLNRAHTTPAANSTALGSLGGYAQQHQRTRRLIECSTTSTTTADAGTNTSRQSRTDNSAVTADISQQSIRSRTGTPSLSARKQKQHSGQSQGNGSARRQWGRTIEEDCIDAAKRSYTGQYLLSTDRLPIAL